MRRHASQRAVVIQPRKNSSSRMPSGSPLREGSTGFAVKVGEAEVRSGAVFGHGTQQGRPSNLGGPHISSKRAAHGSREAIPAHRAFGGSPRGRSRPKSVTR
jgi:hypothetical protein